MSAPSTQSAERALILSEEEQRFLLSLLEQALRDKHVEAHRTEAFDYKEYVQRQEIVLQGLVDKMRRL